MALELETTMQVGLVKVANLQELKSDLSLALEEFKKMPITKANFGNLKDARARLNRASDSFNKRRIELGKIYSAPFDNFKKEVNEIVGMIDDVVKPIDEEIKKMEEEDKAKKREEIMEMFKQHFQDSKVPFDKYWDDRYLNYSYLMDDIKKDLYAKFNLWHNNLVIIDKLELSYQDKQDLKVHYLMTLNLEESMKFINDRNAILHKINDDKNAEGEVVFQVIGSYEELNKLSQFLKQNKYNYKRLK
jgi:hypothetical protein